MPTALTTDGTEVFYERQGSGPALLLLSGTGHDHGFWAGQLPHFTPHFTVYTVDNRGVGRTRVKAHDYSLADMADDAVAALRAEGVESAHVMGFSQGGHIAQEVALRHPDMVRSLGVHHSWARPCQRLHDFQSLRLLLAEKGDRDSLVRVSLLALHAPDYYNLRGAEMAAHRDFLIRNSPPNEGWAGQLRACLSGDTLDRLGKIAVPTLVTTSTMDLAVPPALSHEIAARIPGAEMVVLDGTGHVALMERPEEFARICLDFLHQVAGAGGRVRD